MQTGAITPYIDVAQLVLYLFWLFFAGLIYYLVRENHREGYPMDSGRENGPKVTGWPVPDPKTFRLANGREVMAPAATAPETHYQGKASHAWIGAPLEPVGDPLLAGVGPGAWAQRADEVDLTPEGHAKIVPLRTLEGFAVAAQDVDPRGLSVIGADKAVAGTVKDLWLDRMEMMFRYLEVELPGGATVLAPMTFARVRADGVQIEALLAAQFAKVPTTRDPQQITLLEEERITAYFGAGTLYATPDRQEPLY